MTKKIGFIGAGTMGSAIIEGLLDTAFVNHQEVFASEIDKNKAKEIHEKLHIKVFTDNNDLANICDVIVLCVKPYFIKDVIEQIKDNITEKKIILSIAAGVKTQTIEEIIDKNIEVIRVMPNTPASIKQGMSVISKGKYATENTAKYALELFSKVGESIEVEESLIDAVTGISGSGPAFIYLIIEAMAQGGIELGLDKDKAIKLACQTAIGGANMILKYNEKSPEQLRKEVATPGGSTERGLITMEEEKIFEKLIKTVKDTAKRAEELG